MAIFVISIYFCFSDPPPLKVNVTDRQSDGRGGLICPGPSARREITKRLHDAIHFSSTSLILNNIKIWENGPNLTFPTLKMTF